MKRIMVIAYLMAISFAAQAGSLYNCTATLAEWKGSLDEKVTDEKIQFEIFDSCLGEDEEGCFLKVDGLPNGLPFLLTQRESQFSENLEYANIKAVMQIRKGSTPGSVKLNVELMRAESSKESTGKLERSVVREINIAHARLNLSNPVGETELTTWLDNSRSFKNNQHELGRTIFEVSCLGRRSELR